MLRTDRLRLPGPAQAVLLPPALLLALACVAAPPPGPEAGLVPAPGSPYAIGGAPAEVAAGDLDGDGDDDLVIAESAGDRLVVMLSEGRDGLAPARATALSAGFEPHLVALGDLDGDGRLDVAVTSHDSNAVSLLRGDGRGGFAPFPTSPLATGSPDPPHNHGLRLADIDADGDLDLLFGNQNADSVAILLGDGHGAFTPTPASPVPVGHNPYPFALGDLDGDGTLDLAVPAVGGASLTLLRGDGHGGFAPFPASPLATPARPFYVSLADLDGDGDLDLVVSHDDASTLSIRLNDGHAAFRSAPSPQIASATWKLAVADLDGDGHVDLAGGTPENRVRVLLGNGDGTFHPGPILDTERGTWTVATADLDGDHHPDLVAIGSEAGTVSAWLQR